MCVDSKNKFSLNSVHKLLKVENSYFYIVLLDIKWHKRHLKILKITFELLNQISKQNCSEIFPEQLDLNFNYLFNAF